MIIPQFLRFYGGYTNQSLLNEYAVTFFSLINDLFRIQAVETIDGILEVSAGMASGSDRQEVLAKLNKQAEGLKGIIKEVRTIKGK